MSTHNICFCGEVRKIAIQNSALSGAMKYTKKSEYFESIWYFLIKCRCLTCVPQPCNMLNEQIL